jgi:hypothetical protein
MKQLTNKTKQHTQVQALLLNNVLLRGDREVIRSILDGLLGKNCAIGRGLEILWKKTR